MMLGIHIVRLRSPPPGAQIKFWTPDDGPVTVRAGDAPPGKEFTSHL